MTVGAGARLPGWSRLLYASGSLGGSAIRFSRDLWLIFYYAPPADSDISQRAASIQLPIGDLSLPPIVVVGAVLSALRVIEALDDPLIGYWSDRTRTRWGRRIPFVLAATPWLSIFFVLLWMPPDAGDSARNVLYLFAALWFFHLFSTLSGGPFESLLPEIAPRHDDRLSIVSWQVAFGVVGAVLGLVVSPLIVDVWGFRGMGILIAVVALVSRFVALGGVWRRTVETARDRRDQPSMPSFRRAVLTCLQNGQFLVFLPSFILYNMGVQMMTGVLPYFVSAVLEQDEPGAMVSLLTGALILVLILALPAIVVLTRRRSKRLVYSWGMLFAALYFPLFFFVGFLPAVPREAQALVFAAFLGLPLAPVQTFPNALIADITDYDALRTGMRREATYYATQATLEKTASALAPLLLTLLLALGSTTDNPIGIRLVGPVAGVATLLGYLVFRSYWLPDHVTEETVRAAAPRSE